MAQLWGVVKDNLGNPVNDATVHAVDIAHPRIHHTDRTGPAGFWAIGGLPLASSFVVVAEPPFHRPELLPSARMTVTLPGASNPYTLTLNASPKIVSGTVTSNLGGTNGLPVQNALVVAHRVDRNGEASTLSGADGRYQLRLSAGLWALTVKPISTTTPAHWVFPLPPQLVHFRHDTTPEGKTQDFRVLIADSTVVGKVQLPGGGTFGTFGVPGPFSVTVALFNNEGVGRKTTVQVTEPFTLRVPHGGYRVVVHPHSPQFLGPLVDPIRVEPNSTYDLGTLTLVAKDAAITGTVRDEGGSGVAGIPVVAWRAGAPDTLRTRTAPDGRYLLPLTAGTWHVQPAPGPAQPYLYTGEGQSVTLASGQVQGGVVFTLTDAAATINGQLVDEAGNPLTDVDGWARAVNANVQNGAPIQDGEFTIFVPPGTYGVIAALPAGSPYMSGAEKQVSVSDSVSVTLTVLEKDALITGGLWDPRKQEVVTGVDGDVGVWSDGNWAATPINKGNGTFRLDVAAGLWHLGYRIDPDAGYVKLVPFMNVPVDPRVPAVVPLWVVQKDAVITGTVLDPNGLPRAGVPVIARAIREGGKDVVLRTLSADDGSFRLEVPHARYRLGALGGGPNLIKPVEKVVVVAAGETSGGHILQFRAPDATLSGALTIDGPSGLSGEALVWAWSDDGGFVKGRFPITAATGTLSSGFYTLNVLSNTTWHVGAAFETDTQFWFARDRVTLGSGNATLDLTLSGPNAKPGPVVVTFDAADPQRIELADGTHIFIPGGAMPVSGEVTLRIVPIATLPHQKHADVYKYGYAFLATDSSGQTIEDHFNQDVIIGFRYTDAELAALNIFEPNLRPAYYSTTDDNWTFPDSYAVDTDANIVTMQIDHFTD
ncbi:MAG: carboxypeptidase regulatory-like domain-containing protein, partial [Caldilineae bacterium]